MPARHCERSDSIFLKPNTLHIVAGFVTQAVFILLQTISFPVYPWTT